MDVCCQCYKGDKLENGQLDGDVWCGHCEEWIRRTLLPSDLKKFEVGVTWEVWGKVKVEAYSEEHAIELAKEAELPKNPDYIEDSFEVDEEHVFQR